MMKANIMKAINSLLLFHTKVKYSTRYFFFCYFMPIGVLKVPFRCSSTCSETWSIYHIILIYFGVKALSHD